MRYHQFKIRPTGQRTLPPEQELDEVAMSPGALNQFLSSPAAEGIRAGFEAEVIFAEILADVSNFDGESEPDYDSDETAYDIDQIAEFFAQGSESRGRVREQLLQSYNNWFALNQARARANQVQALCGCEVINQQCACGFAAHHNGVAHLNVLQFGS